MVPTPNKKPFLTFLIFSPYVCSYFSLLTFSYILLYFSYLGIAIFYGAMNFEFNLFLKRDCSIKTFVSLLIVIWMPYFIGDKLGCYWELLLLRNRRIHCEGYSTISILGFQYQTSNKPVTKIKHYVLANSLTWLGVHLVLDQWFNQTLCVS